MILKLYEDVAKPYGLEHITIELGNQGKWNGPNFPLKNLVVNFSNSIFDNSNWGKIIEVTMNKSTSPTEWDSRSMVKRIIAN